MIGSIKSWVPNFGKENDDDVLISNKRKRGDENVDGRVTNAKEVDQNVKQIPHENHAIQTFDSISTDLDSSQLKKSQNSLVSIYPSGKCMKDSSYNHISKSKAPPIPFEPIMLALKVKNEDDSSDSLFIRPSKRQNVNDNDASEPAAYGRILPSQVKATGTLPFFVGSSLGSTEGIAPKPVRNFKSSIKLPGLAASYNTLQPTEAETTTLRGTASQNSSLQTSVTPPNVSDVSVNASSNIMSEDCDHLSSTSSSSSLSFPSSFSSSSLSLLPSCTPYSVIPSSPLSTVAVPIATAIPSLPTPTVSSPLKQKSYVRISPPAPIALPVSPHAPLSILAAGCTLNIGSSDVLPISNAPVHLLPLSPILPLPSSPSVSPPLSSPLPLQCDEEGQGREDGVQEGESKGEAADGGEKERKECLTGPSKASTIDLPIFSTTNSDSPQLLTVSSSLPSSPPLLPLPRDPSQGPCFAIHDDPPTPTLFFAPPPPAPPPPPTSQYSPGSSPAACPWALFLGSQVTSLNPSPIARGFGGDEKEEGKKKGILTIGTQGIEEQSNATLGDKRKDTLGCAGVDNDKNIRNTLHNGNTLGKGNTLGNQNNGTKNNATKNDANKSNAITTNNNNEVMGILNRSNPDENVFLTYLKSSANPVVSHFSPMPITAVNLPKNGVPLSTASMQTINVHNHHEPQPPPPLPLPLPQLPPPQRINNPITNASNATSTAANSIFDAKSTFASTAAPFLPPPLPPLPFPLVTATVGIPFKISVSPSSPESPISPFGFSTPLQAAGTSSMASTSTTTNVTLTSVITGGNITASNTFTIHNATTTGAIAKSTGTGTITTTTTTTTNNINPTIPTTNSTISNITTVANNNKANPSTLPSMGASIGAAAAAAAAAEKGRKGGGGDQGVDGAEPREEEPREEEPREGEQREGEQREGEQREVPISSRVNGKVVFGKRRKRSGK